MKNTTSDHSLRLPKTTMEQKFERKSKRKEVYKLPENRVCQWEDCSWECKSGKKLAIGSVTYVKGVLRPKLVYSPM
jgi:hypothetical protein